MGVPDGRGSFLVVNLDDLRPGSGMTFDDANDRGQQHRGLTRLQAGDTIFMTAGQSSGTTINSDPFDFGSAMLDVVGP